MRAGGVARLAWPLCVVALLEAAGLSVLDVLNRAQLHSFSDAQPADIMVPLSFALLGRSSSCAAPATGSAGSSCCSP